MSSYKERIKDSIREAQEFINRANLVLDGMNEADEKNEEARVFNEKHPDLPLYQQKYYCNSVSTTLTASMKRKSMDLTRSLAQLRKPQ